MTGLRRRSALAILAALLVLGGCFEPPVEERLEIEIRADGCAEIEVAIAISRRDEATLNRQVERRLDDLERALLGGWDDWTPRFDSLAPVAERGAWEKADGRLAAWERRATLADAAELADFFAATDLSVFWSHDGERMELAIYPGNPSRATRRQRRQVEVALAAWSATLERYLAAGAALYRYLESHPDRAVDCLGEIFEDVLADEVAAVLGDLSAEEEALTEGLEEAMGEALEVLQPEPGEAYSLDELSHRVYDPFPARLTLRGPSEPVEAEGFAAGSEGRLRVEGLGLWQSLAALGGKWLSPEPMLLWVEHGRSGEPLDLAAVAASQRHAAPVTAGEILRALEDRLTPAPAYRAVWAPR